MQIVILNGGLGKRVRSVSREKPKCLIKINKKTFLEHQINLFYKKKFTKIFLCLGFKNDKIIKFLKNLDYHQNLIQYSVEKKRLGTAGAIVNCKKRLDDIFFVVYGDSWLNVNYKNLYETFKKKRKPCLLTLIHGKKIKNHSNNILLKKNKIIEYSKIKNKNFNYIDYGILIFRKKIFQKYKKGYRDLGQILQSLIKGNKVSFKKVNKKFYEIGSISGIKELKKYIKKNNELP